MGEEEDQMKLAKVFSLIWLLGRALIIVVIVGIQLHKKGALMEAALIMGVLFSTLLSIIPWVKE